MVKYIKHSLIIFKYTALVLNAFMLRNISTIHLQFFSAYKTETLKSLNHFPKALGNYHPSFWLSYINETVCLFVSGLHYLTQCLQGYLWWLFNFILCIWVFCLHMCLYMPGQKKVSDLLELELQMVVSHHVGARNWTSGRTVSALSGWAISPTPCLLCFVKAGCLYAVLPVLELTM